MTGNLTPGGNRGRTFPAEPLSQVEVQQLMDGMNRGVTGTRNRALVAVLYRSGLRVSEALALRVKDVDRDARSIRVLRGKGGKSRVVGIDDGGLRYLERWLEARGERGLPASAPVFCKLDGGEWDPSAVRRMLGRAGEAAGLGKRVHPHGLRHSMAAELAREGVPATLIQRQLGHGSLGTTNTYLQSIASAEVIEAMGNREWAVA